MESIYLDEELNPIENPDLDWCNIEEREVDGEFRIVCHPYTDEERAERMANLEKLGMVATPEELETALVELSDAFAALAEKIGGE